MKLSEVDLNDLDTFEKGTPHDQFKLLRNEAPVYRHRGGPGQEDFWCITKHEDLKQISKSPQLFSSERMGAIMRDRIAQLQELGSISEAAKSHSITSRPAPA